VALLRRVHRGFNCCWRCCCVLLQAARLEDMCDAFACKGGECARLQEQLESTNRALVSLVAEVTCVKVQLQEGVRREAELQVCPPANACRLPLQDAAVDLPRGLQTMHSRCAHVCDDVPSCEPSPAGTQFTI
jgi:hypothetical protein